MIITLFPTRSDQPMILSREGSRLTINDRIIDLDDYLDGQIEWIIGQPVYDGTQWLVDLVLPHGSQAGKETLFPDRIRPEGNGPITLPPYDVL